METIPLDIPGQFRRSSSTQFSRQASLLLSSSYFCASSLHHPRNAGVAFSEPVNDAMERKLTRTRKMSESIRSGASLKRMTTIPTVKEEIGQQVRFSFHGNQFEMLI